MSIVRLRSTGLAETGLVIVAVAAMSLMVPGEAAARRSRHIAHHRVLSEQTKSAQTAMLPQTAYLGSMRYYGGPKSPMWRQ